MDFTTSQTRTERINLRVIVRPSVPQILDNTGAVLDLYAGPYRYVNIIVFGSVRSSRCVVQYLFVTSDPRQIFFKTSILIFEPQNNSLSLVLDQSQRILYLSNRLQTKDF